MNKPDGITQEAWDAAIVIADVWQNPMHHDHQVMAQDVARAIDASIEKERQECLSIAFGYRHRDTGREIYELIELRNGGQK